MSDFTARMNANTADAYSTKGAMIMKLSDLIFKSLRGRLTKYHDHSGMPIEPVKIRAMSLNIAQQYLKAKGQI